MKTVNILSYAFVGLFMLSATACASNSNANSYGTDRNEITRAMIEQAQEGWIAALVSVGAAEDPSARAYEVLTNYYDFSGSGVLFKPTLTHGEQTFRMTKDGALSYFVGGNAAFAQDDGFALRPYVSGVADIKDVVIVGKAAIAMGNITLTAYDGSTVMVDKTFGYRMDENGNLRIITHHSSLPFSPN
ncbi:MAG: phosphoribosyl-AMP cyclohydrolase [Bacteroidetes bacterium]|nr:phosphoribosyl-AMP cyclohydrolase [Bacteroidota bacterium]MCH8525231.1 hypothetical protein [Balneolales bacterium]